MASNGTSTLAKSIKALWEAAEQISPSFQDQQAHFSFARQQAAQEELFEAEEQKERVKNELEKYNEDEEDEDRYDALVAERKRCVKAVVAAKERFAAVTYGAAFWNDEIKVSLEGTARRERERISWAKEQYAVSQVHNHFTRQIAETS